MKSNVYTFVKNSDDFRNIPEEAEKVAVYNKLGKKESMRLRLLAEELICMLPQLVRYGNGEFWIENKNNDYELHIRVSPENFVLMDREKILSVSKSGKNAASKGIMSKILIAVERMVEDRAKLANDTPYDFYDMGMTEYGDYSAWSLMSYKNCVMAGYEKEKEQAEEKWDELEKSIIAKLSDDVIVGIISNKIDIIVKKRF